MRPIFVCSIVAPLTAAAPSFAQGDSRPAPAEPKTVETKPVAAPAPATETQQGSGSYQGFGLIQNGHAMLGIHPPRK